VKIRGILPLNKPSDLSSYDCIRKLKPILPNTKIGHAGTLDPMAQGLLLILLNEATKIADYLSTQDKEYVAKIRLGITTDTDDITGQIIKDEPCENITKQMVQAVIDSMIGEIEQVPPKFSALKQDGQRAYKLARKGIDFSLKPRKINIKAIELMRFSLPIIEIKTTVSKGTYIRSMARDIGDKLGCGATLEGLTRTRIGKFKNENSVELDEINQNNIAELIYPINEAISEIPAIVVDEQEIDRLCKGQPITNIGSWKLEIGNFKVRIVDNQNRVLIMGKCKEDKIYPERLIYADK